MTTEEQYTQRGKSITLFQEAKGKLADLRSQAQELSQRLIRIGQSLPKDPIENGALDSIIDTLPSKAEIQQLVTDMRTAQRTITDVQKQMRQIGIEIS